MLVIEKRKYFSLFLHFRAHCLTTRKTWLYCRCGEDPSCQVQTLTRRSWEQESICSIFLLQLLLLPAPPLHTPEVGEPQADQLIVDQLIRDQLTRRPPGRRWSGSGGVYLMRCCDVGVFVQSERSGTCRHKRWPRPLRAGFRLTPLKFVIRFGSRVRSIFGHLRQLWNKSKNGGQFGALVSQRLETAR